MALQWAQQISGGDGKNHLLDARDSDQSFSRCRCFIDNFASACKMNLLKICFSFRPFVQYRRLVPRSYSASLNSERGALSSNAFKWNIDMLIIIFWRTAVCSKVPFQYYGETNNNSLFLSVSENDRYSGVTHR